MRFVSRIRFVAAVAALVLCNSAVAATNVDIDALLRRGGLTDVKISPDGQHLAATVQLPDRTGFAIIRRSDGVRTANILPDERNHVGEFHWVSNERVLVAPEYGGNLREDSRWYGEIFGINVDNSKAATVIPGLRQFDNSASRISSRAKETAVASLVDDLAGDDKQVVVSISALADPYTRAELVDSTSGSGKLVAKVDVKRATFTTDPAGVVRFALGTDDDSFTKLLYRPSADGEWRVLNDETSSGLVERAVGFSADGAVAYLQVEHAQGPDAIVAFDVATGTRKTVFRDPVVDPWRIIRGHGFAGPPVGVMVMDGKPRSVFFDEASEDARLYRTLELAFPGQGVEVTSTTRDGRLALVRTYAGHSPGDFYVFDRQTKRVEHIASVRDWLDPDTMATVEPVGFTARDGQRLLGYLTRMPGGQGPQPMVIKLHRGPVNEPSWPHNVWQFDDEAQILAQAGYSVLQLDYRGSGNRGRAFREAIAGKWDSLAPRDIADAARWAVQEGLADAKRICLYGTSFGSYAAIVGAAQEPGLYRCVAANGGDFDLALKRQALQATIANALQAGWLDRWMGPVEVARTQSATRYAPQVNVPVFLAGYGEDSATPNRQFQAMRKALASANVPTTVYRHPTATTAGAGQRGRREHIVQLLDFLSLNLGGGKAKKPQAADDGQ